MSNLPIIKADEISIITTSMPQALADNRQSHDRCIAACTTLLDAINAHGMTPELDTQAAAIIDRARRTVKKMGERRSPATKVFDEIRKLFTTLENGIDPTKSGNVVYQLQQARNEYARRLHEAEQQRIFAEQQRKRIEQATARLTSDINDYICAEFNSYVEQAISLIENLEQTATIENYSKNFDAMAMIKPTLNPNWGNTLKGFPLQPYHAPMTDADVQRITKETITGLMPRFAKQFEEEVGTTLEDTLRRMPSRLAELKRIAAADAQEAARIKADMEAKAKAEQQRAEAERRQREEKARQEAELQQRQQSMANLFDSAAIAQPQAPKAKVTKKIHITNPKGILPIISMWFLHVGYTLTVEEIEKMFSKQIRFCEQLAVKEEITVADENVTYSDEVKAK